MLTVMSFNIRNSCDRGTEAWDARLVNFVPLVKSANPDLIGFQEVLPNQYLDLIRLFPEYGSVGKGRDDGVDAGERAAIFYKKERLALLDTGDFWLSESPGEPSFGWDAACIRICTHARFSDNKTGKEFAHYNTHLDHVGQTAMLEGAKIVKARVLAGGTPAIVTGDFNVSEQSAPYKLMTQGGLSDAKHAAKSSMSHGTFHGYNPGENIGQESPIDYIFFTDGKFIISSYKVLVNGGAGCYTSDHYPVLAELEQA